MINYSHSVLSLCSNYCLYAATGGVADGGVANAVNILSFALFIFLYAHLYISSRGDHVWLKLKPKCEQVLFVYVFTIILPRLTDQCNFITVLIVTREPEQTSFCFEARRVT